jgi:hypothetical protein
MSDARVCEAEVTAAPFHLEYEYYAAPATSDMAFFPVKYETITWRLHEIYI